MLRLIVKMPGGGEASFHVEGEDLFVGRVSSINDICLNDPSVSRQHAHLKLREEGYTIYDLKSLNGIKVNGKSVARSVLKHGDEIRLGSVEVTVVMRDATKEEELIAIEQSEQTEVGARLSDVEEATRPIKISDVAGRKKRSARKKKTRKTK